MQKFASEIGKILKRCRKFASKDAKKVALIGKIVKRCRKFASKDAKKML